MKHKLTHIRVWFPKTQKNVEFEIEPRPTESRDNASYQRFMVNGLKQDFKEKAKEFLEKQGVPCLDKDNEIVITGYDDEQKYAFEWVPI